MRIAVRLSIVFSLAVATSLQAITYIVPNDRDLVKRAEAIIVATAVESHPELRDEGRIVTVATMQVDRVLKGSITGETVHVTEMGGVIGQRATLIPGSPRYETGKRYLVFLRTNKFAEWTTYGFGLGKFEFISDLEGRELLTRGSVNDELFGFEEKDWSPHVERLRGADEFVNFVRTLANGDTPAREGYVIDRSSVVLTTFPEFLPKADRFVPIAEATRADYLLAGNFRWQSPAATFVYCCGPTFEPGFDGPGDSSSAMANWNAAGAGISYTLGSIDNTANKGFTSSDCKNAILFNDPNNEITGAAAIGGITATGTNCVPPPGQPTGPFTYTLSDGITYNKTLEVDVVVGKSIGTNEATFVGVLTHELGHTLGFRHSDGTSDPMSPQNGHSCAAPSPCAGIGAAIMASVIQFNLNSLQQWDLDAAQTNYGSGPVCTPPSISVQPSGTTITSGQQTTLSVTAAGTSPTYQWYVGNPPNTTTTAPSTTNQLTVAPTATTTYFVRVSGCSTFIDSRPVTVTVNQPVCVPPSAPTPSAFPSSVQAGQSSTLSVNPTGTGPFTYQWFIGNSGNTATPIAGATGSSTSVSPTTNTSYWVRVTGQCAPSSDSPAVTVTVTCTPIASGPTAQPSTITAGGTSTLSIATAGSGPFTIQWYTGNVGDTSNPIQGANSTSVQVSPSNSAVYWVHVTAPCGSQDASVIVFVSGSPCTPASITTHPGAVTINPGSSTTLSVVVAGTPPITYQWYTGTSGNTSNPIPNANGPSITVTPTQTITTYWVHVSNSCNTVGVNSTTGVVTLASCTSPPITTQPAGVTAGIGTTVTLKVVATGSVHYQWYKGVKGDISTKVGTDSDSFTTPTITGNASYWVRVTAACGTTSFSDSNTANIVAVMLRNHAVRH